MLKTIENKRHKVETALLIVYFQLLCLFYGMISILIKVSNIKGLLATNIVVSMLLIALYAKIIFSSKFKDLPKSVLWTFLGMFVAAITVIFLNFGHQ